MHVCPQLASVSARLYNMCVCVQVYLRVCATAWSQRQIERCTVWAQMLTQSHAHSHTHATDTQPHGQTLVQALPAGPLPLCLILCPATAPGLPGLVTYKSDLHNSNNAHFGAKRIANYLLKSPTHAQIQIVHTCTFIYTLHTHIHYTHIHMYLYKCIAHVYFATFDGR